MSDDMTQQEYRDEIESSVQIAIREVQRSDDFPVDSDRFVDEVIEEVAKTADAHEWIIYNGYALDILNHARNDPEEWQNFIDGSEKNHWAVLNAMAYAAFRQDLFDEASDALADLRSEACH